ncbi:ArsR/SmtB family transcription factor [Paraferrimonas sedimenticola]|uniref:Transcriptional regulator n=1 Tax=Paraferrimonas sedimenticola TaxID=375674 RepID=A0AA37W2R0_9GAMM|nr:metalloregulator ArsR/SmtB family transcription factor [Paraferrimonas sedimenticola]GLP97993.1 transcriptional regulator [Paraferrimonas sedimenticola]
MTAKANMSLEAMGQQCEKVAQVMKVLSHPKRLLILCHLAQGEQSVSQLEGLTGLSQSQVSQFLKAMSLQGLIQARSDGSYKYFSVVDKELEQLLEALHQVYC